MTRPWQHPPEAQTVAVVHALQDLLVCATEPSELRAVLGGAQGRRGRCWSPTGPGVSRDRGDGRPCRAAEAPPTTDLD